jgi:hypothetical protein
MSHLFYAMQGTTSLANAAFGSSKEEEEALQQLGAYDDYYYEEPYIPTLVVTGYPDGEGEMPPVEPPSLMEIMGQPKPESHVGWHNVEHGGGWWVSAGVPSGIVFGVEAPQTSLDCSLCHLP